MQAAESMSISPCEEGSEGCYHSPCNAVWLIRYGDGSDALLLSLLPMQTDAVTSLRAVCATVFERRNLSMDE